jgi:UPF0176 protein
MADTDDADETPTTIPNTTPQHVILFYMYHPLSADPGVTELYRKCIHDICSSLERSGHGRILVGCSKTEGIDGTLTGRYENMQAVTVALCSDTSQDTLEGTLRSTVDPYRQDSRVFFETIDEEELGMQADTDADDFEWSKTTTSHSDDPLFPDLNTKLVKELIRSGGAMADIGIEETSAGYLTPSEWHAALESKDVSDDNDTKSDTIIIDCHDTKEYEYTIGHFEVAVDPQTTTFAGFGKWVRDHQVELQDKKVLMHCTGGIRCEKASSFIRREVNGVQDAKHLKGGTQ